MRPSRRHLAVLALGCAAAPLRAQTARPAAPRPSVVQTASINLLGLPFGFVSGEYERAVGRNGFAVGVGGLATFLSDGDGNDALLDASGDQFRSLQAKLKYYPAANGLRGFAVGATAGFVSATGYQFVSTGADPVTGYPLHTTTTHSTISKPTLGAVLDYNFLIGRQRRFLVGVGVGARRVLNRRRSDDVRYLLDRSLVDGRLQIGFGF